MMGRIVWGSQWFIKKSFRKFGIEIARYFPPKDEYARCYPYAYYTYAPWREKNFLSNYAKVANRSTLTEDRSYILSTFARHCLNFEGDYAECGVYQGASAHMIAETITQSPRPLHLFDTFEGMPIYVKDDPSGHRVGDFGDTSLKNVQQFLSSFDFIEYHPGVIPQTYARVEDRKFAFVHVDVDLYRSVQECCEFFYERLVPGGMMIFDDYGFRQYELSARKAVDEFFANRIEKPISLHSGQCFIIKI